MQHMSTAFENFRFVDTYKRDVSLVEIGIYLGATSTESLVEVRVTEGLMYTLELARF